MVCWRNEKFGLKRLHATLGIVLPITVRTESNVIHLERNNSHCEVRTLNGKNPKRKKTVQRHMKTCSNFNK